MSLDSYLNESTTWLISLGIILGLAFVFMQLLDGDLTTFLTFLTVFCMFFVWVTMLDLWVLIVVLVLDVVAIGYNLKNGGGSGGGKVVGSSKL